MSRSIHATSREFERLVRSGAPREEVREAALVLRDKHRIKRAVGRERRLRDVPEPPVMDVVPDVVPVRVYDRGPHIHHGASAEDVREVLRRLPPGTTDGLAVVNFKLGRPEQLTSRRRWPGGEQPDPFTGRYGVQVAPGIWSGRVRGRYRPRRTAIEIYAYVITEPEPPDWPYWRFALRFEALKTLVHEAAHHHDHVCRVARGRWRAAAGRHAETYAEARTREWLRSIVGPYVFERYPEGDALVDEYEARENPGDAPDAGPAEPGRC